MDDEGEAGAVLAAQDLAALVGDGDVLDPLDDAPGAEVAPGQAIDEVALGDHERLRRARTKPRVRSAGVAIERQRGSG
jgi:hypothetical protein